MHREWEAAAEEGSRRRTGTTHVGVPVPQSAGMAALDCCRRPVTHVEGVAGWVQRISASPFTRSRAARAPRGGGRMLCGALFPVVSRGGGESLSGNKIGAAHESLHHDEAHLHPREAGARRCMGQHPRGGLRGYQPVVWWAAWLLLLMQCQGFRQAGAGPERSRSYASMSTLERSRSYASMGTLKTTVPSVPSLPVLGVDPEYTCVYEEYTGDYKNQIGSANTYAQYLAAHNRQLRSKVAEGFAGPYAPAVGTDVEGTGGGASGDVAMLSLRDGSLGMLSHDTPVDPFVGRTQQDEQWREDVGQRYKELIPPNHPHPNKKRGSTSRRTRSTHRMMSADDLRKAAEQALSTSNSLSWTPVGEKKDLAGRGMVEEAVLVLDLDKCSFYGSDGNDLGIALQWMERGPDLVHQLYSLLLNPQVKATYARLRERATRVRVVIYTMRATFLVYHSCFRDQTVPLRWNPDWHHGAQVCPVCVSVCLQEM